MKYNPIPQGFTPWQPSTWPDPPSSYVEEFRITLESILKETMLNEIDNVISDSIESNGNLTHRGHVVALALLCAIDSVASYAFSNITGKGSTGKRYKKFISTFFPTEYQPFVSEIYKLYRNSFVHSWNLFQATIWPSNEPIIKEGNSLSFGLLHFQEAFRESINNFLSELPNDPMLQSNSLKRYFELKTSAQP